MALCECPRGENESCAHNVAPIAPAITNTAVAMPFHRVEVFIEVPFVYPRVDYPMTTVRVRRKRPISVG